MKLVLIDGYVDEPSAFGVPPVMRRWRAAIKADRLMRRWTR